jgi:hypothetical protein
VHMRSKVKGRMRGAMVRTMRFARKGYASRQFGQVARDFRARVCSGVGQVFDLPTRVEDPRYPKTLS